MRTRPRKLTASALLLAVLAGCTSTEAVLDPSAVAPAPASPALPATTPPAAPAPANSPELAARLATARLQFAPVVGATVGAAGPLSARLKARASERGVAVVNAQGGATHLMKGYFSAIADGNDTLVIFVWDVIDPAGNRLHRIQGQEKVSGSDPDPWTAVSQETMEKIADRTIDDFAAWLGASQG